MKYQIGTEINGFTILRGEFIKEISADAYILEHIKTKAKLMYIDSEDDNKVFSVSFRTPPTDSTGVAHIMEHSVLCGSDKYPVKEPFVELIKGSLNTFVNAMTFPDKTMYPVASRNKQDFHNLMEVYLDAVFSPAIRHDYQILMQEGWHYEIESPDEPIIYKGVVYNEMKGALSSPDDIMERKVTEILFPDTTYGFESGGDPEVIPELTFTQFKDFYNTYYHPSNSYFFLYGDMNIEETLAFINEEYLAHYEYKEMDTRIATQLPLPERAEAVYEYGVAKEDSLAEKTLHGLDIVLPDDVTTAESLAMDVLNYALLMVPGAIIRRRIVDAGVGKDIFGSYTDSIKQPMWHIEVVGSEPELRDEFIAIFDKTIMELVDEGIDKKLLESSLNRIEFALREADYKGRPRGLFYNIRAMSYWLYDRDPFPALRYEEDLRVLREGLENGYFEELLRNYVRNNTHQAAVSMVPIQGLTEKKEAEEAAKLAQYKASLTETEIEHLIRETKSLQERQKTEDSEEALSCIPLLTREDLPREVDQDKLEETKQDSAAIYHYEGDSRGIVYTNLYFPIAHISPAEYPYAVLLAEVLTNVDTKHFAYADLAREINMYTGGIGIGISAYPHYLDANMYRPCFTVSGKALSQNTDKLFKLINEIISHTVFTDSKRIQELLYERKAEWDIQMFRRGAALMTTRVLSYGSAAEAFRDAGELNYYEFLTRAILEDPAIIAERLSQIAKKVFVRDGLTVLSVGTEEERRKCLAELPVITDELDSCQIKEFADNWILNKGNEAFLSVGKVQYVAQGGNFRTEGYDFNGSMRVLETMLRYGYLWQHIRVLGGAYGAFSRISTNGNTAFCSYRDPNLRETLDVYRNMPAAIADFNVSDRTMTQYIIGTMAQTQIQYTLRMKAVRAMTRIFTEVPSEFRQQVRNQIIDCRQADIRALAPAIEAVINQGNIAVMGGETKINENSDIFHHIKSFHQ